MPEKKARRRRRKVARRRKNEKEHRIEEIRQYKARIATAIRDPLIAMMPPTTRDPTSNSGVLHICIPLETRISPPGTTQSAMAAKF